MGALVYILRCSDGSYYTGITRASLEDRVAQHGSGTFGGYTARRRPMKLVFQQEFDRITDAIAAERQIKNWSRAKKEALVRGDFAKLQTLARSTKRQLQEHPASLDKLGVRTKRNGIDDRRD